MDDKTLKQKLTPEQYAVLCEKATEPPFSGEFLKHKDDGKYVCAACNQPLFSSKAKFESGSGWPSFYDVIKTGNIKLEEDTSHGMVRTEVLCANCGSHLGHLFDDGPNLTGQRYCINSLALDFEKENEGAGNGQ